MSHPVQGISVSLVFGWLALQPLAVLAAETTTLPKIRVEEATDDDEGRVARSTSAGSKIDVPLIETPQSISVITRERLDTLGATSVQEALSYTAGVQSQAYGTDSRFDWISIRGFDGYTPGFLQDGLLARNNNTWAVWRIEPFGMERIEVLRGPASVLYGQGNPGGLVNAVSKQPRAEPFAEFGLQAGRFDRRQGTVDVGGNLSGDEQWLYRVTGLVLDSDTQVDHIENDRRFIAPALTWQLSADTRLTFLSQYLEEDTASTLGFLPLSGTLLSNPNGRIPRSRFVGEPGYDHFDRTQWALGYQFETRLNDAWSLRQNTRYGRMDIDYKQVYGVGLDAADASQRTLLRSAFTSREQADLVTIDNQGEVRFATGPWQQTLLLGLDYQHNDFDQKSGIGAAQSIDIFNPRYGQSVTDPPLYANADYALEQTGLYLQDQAKLHERWVVVLGLRHDWSSLETTNRLAVTRDRQNDDELTGRIGLVYVSDVGLAPYLNYSESFFPVAGIDATTGAAFKPETAQQYEAGLKYQPAGSDSFFTVAAFNIERQNYITYDSNFIARQTGEVRSRGLELEAATKLGAGFNLNASYTWLADFDITKSSSSIELDKRRPTVPEHMASLWADYNWSAGPLAGFGLGGGIRYVGTTFGDSANTAALKVPDYTLLDAMLHYDVANWRFAVNAKNLTDKRYFVCDGNCYYGSTRDFIASVRYRW